MSHTQQPQDLQALEVRLRQLESLVAHRAKRSVKIDSDSPLLPGMDDFNFSEEEFAAFDPSTGAVEWAPPYRFPNGNPRGLTWDSGPGGSLYVNSSVGPIDETGDLLAFVDAAEAQPAGIHTAYRFVKTHYRFYYRHPGRGGQLKITAAFSVRNAHIHDAVADKTDGGGGIDLLEFQNLRIAVYKQCGDAWERFGKAIDEYHEWAWDVRWNSHASRQLEYDHNRREPKHAVVLTSQGDLAKDQLTKFYVGIWAGLTLSTTGSAYTTFNRFDVRLDRVRAELV